MQFSHVEQGGKRLVTLRLRPHQDDVIGSAAMIDRRQNSIQFRGVSYGSYDEAPLSIHLQDHLSNRLHITRELQMIDLACKSASCRIINGA